MVEIILIKTKYNPSLNLPKIWNIINYRATAHTVQ